MKLLFVMCLKEDQNTATRILEQAGIKIISATDVTGMKLQGEQDLADQWFSHGRDQVNSVILLSFTDEADAKKALLLIQAHNAKDSSGFPLRGFVLPVEATTHGA
jgi:hypothetical protein